MIEAVYNINRYRTIRELKSIKEGEVKHFTNMPRNVFHTYTHRDDTAMKNDVWNMHDLLLHVSERYPHYAFLTECRFEDNDGMMSAIEISVFSGQEPLGRIRSLGSEGIVFHNNRVQQEVRRGSGKRTTKLSVAKSIFAKYFYGITTNERMEVVADEVNHKLYHTRYDLRSEQKTAEQAVQTFVRSKLDNQFLIDALQVMGGTDLVQKYQEITHELELVNTIDNVKSKDEGYYVLLENEEYFTWRNGMSTPKRLSRETMPQDLKLALGMLKLAEDDTFLAGAGFKLDQNKFFIRDEVQLEFDS
jgi:hypothetical protein